MKLLVATRNRGKLREARALLGPGGFEVVSLDDLGLPETAEEARLELGQSFEHNARSKAEYFAARSGLPTVADDSGLEVIALGGEPGVRSRRWAGATGTDAEIDAANNAELLRRLAGAPAPKRRARYRCVLAYVPRRGAPARVFEGYCTGLVLEAPRGVGGFGYDPLFLSDELGLSFGEAPLEAKNRVSHRGRAYRQLLEALREEQR